MELATAEKIAILDFGAQYGKVIDRRVRECNVYSELLPLYTTADQIIKRGFRSRCSEVALVLSLSFLNASSAIIISGGPNSVYVPDAPLYDVNIFNCNLPILGICYGFQLINKFFGGNVSCEKFREDGQTVVEIDNSSPLFSGMNTTEKVLLTHGDSVTCESVADQFTVIATSGKFVAGIMNQEKKIYGLQFHPEVDLTENGVKIFNNFLRNIVSIKALYTMENREDMCIAKIRELVGEKNVLVMVSGGVDSTVCAALLNKALGADRIVAIHIDNGFMRLNESDIVVESLNKLGLNVHRKDNSMYLDFSFANEFFNGKVHLKKEDIDTPPLKQVCAPEHKRMIIGDTFIQCKDIAISKLGLDADMFLAQGTLRPDLIESASELASGCAEVIKTHHNDTALVRELRSLGKVIEPLQDFHKDEVRELGRALGLPESIVNRHPFPGPGLAIRILCAEQPFIDENFEVLQQDLSNIIETFSKDIQGVVLPIKSVGVQGDCRSYSYVLALTYAHTDKSIPWLLLEKIAKVIPNQVHAINRVVYLFGGHTNHVRDITKTYLTPDTIAQLQKADRIVYEVLCGRDDATQNIDKLCYILPKIQQMPVILVPIHFDRNYENNETSRFRSICLRPFITRDFMTGQAALPGRDIPENSIMEMVSRILDECTEISRVMIDLTSKPPGTTEWE